jgi:hypothetical protein
MILAMVVIMKYKKKEGNSIKEHNNDAKIHHDKKHASKKEHIESTKKADNSNS